MKQYLILSALASTVFSVQGNTPPAVQLVAEARPATPQFATSAKPFTPHQLSAEERAELRRQLYQYSHSRSPAKGS
jgi:hypothetical protein